ncbi:MAG: biotin-dependent carboxyltransferase family protein [Candidatus Limnocylindrales bacterium]
MSSGGGDVFTVRDGGLQTTIQDAGRPEWGHLGVPRSGAADPWSLAVANLLAGNDPGDAALEMLLVGPTLIVHSDLTIGLAGADLGARIDGGRRLVPGRSHRVAGGEILTFRAPSDASEAGPGARGYLAIAGGLDVPIVLGSRSTCLAGCFGGIDGRVIGAGDRLGVRAEDAARGGRSRPPRTPPDLVWPEADGAAGWRPGQPTILRVLPAPSMGAGAEDVATAHAALIERDWQVGSAADRVGVRLDGDPLPAGIGAETTTHGVPWGAIQVPPDGRPIVLGADHQATGGYRVAGVVISADLALIGQLRPGAPVRLVATDRATALAALSVRRAALTAGAAALREAAGWSALIDAAGS